jgi:hypothetical protein
MSDGGRMRITGQAKIPGAWIISNQTITSTGKVFEGPADPTSCNRGTSPQVCIKWVGSLNLRQVVAYQPAGRFWPLQWMELSIFLALTALLAGFCVWWVRRRLT